MFCGFFGSSFWQCFFYVASHHGGWFCFFAEDYIIWSWCEAFGEHLPDFVVI
jgi:hypothetical protein